MRSGNKQTALRRALAIALITGVSFLFSCNVPPSFGPEYYVSTTNYIAGFPLSAPPPASDSGTGTALGAPAAWDWAWRGTMDSAFEYMKMTELAEGTGPSGQGKAWRLECVNLAASPYLEDTTLHPAWTFSGTGSAVQELAAPGAHGQQVKLSSISTNWTGLDPFLFFTDSPKPNYQYALRGQITSSLSKLFYQVEDQGIATWENPRFIVPGADSLFAIEGFSVSAAGTRLMFGQIGMTQTFALDDLRVVRVDRAEALRLRLLLRPSDTTPTLVPGYHEFTLWARVPSDTLRAGDALRVSSPTAAFCTQTLTLAIKQIGFLDLRDSPSSNAKESFTISGEWTQLKLRMPEKSNFERFDEASPDAVIELAIQPFGDGVPDASAVEIAAPELHFYINGY